MTIPIDPALTELPTVLIPLPQDDVDRPVSERVAFKVTVKRHVGVKLKCYNAHEFLATFDEVQRIVQCPTCGASTDIPEQYRGLP